MASITTFIAGFCTHKACMAVRGSGFGTCQFPAQCILITVQNKHWLWDTGYSSHFLMRPLMGRISFIPKLRLFILLIIKPCSPN